MLGRGRPLWCLLKMKNKKNEDVGQMYVLGLRFSNSRLIGIDRKQEYT